MCNREVWCVEDVERIPGKPDYREECRKSSEREKGGGEYCRFAV